MQAIRYNGHIYRVPMAPFETDDRAADRAWYIAKSAAKGTADGGWNRLISESHIYCNEKHMGMHYKENNKE